MKARILVQCGVLFVMLTVVNIAIGVGDIDTRSVPEPDDPAIAYGTKPTADPVGVLNREIEAGMAARLVALWFHR